MSDHADGRSEGPGDGPDSGAGTDDRTAISRRSVVKTLSAGAGLTAFGPAAARGDGDEDEGGDADYWTLVALPDTQFYAESETLAPYASDQTEWIVEHREDEHIRFVTHEGDLVDDADERAQWERIDRAMSTLDGEVPYSTLPGNHDWVVTNDRSSSVENYLERFGPSRFEDRPWFGGASPNGLNTYQLFTAGDREFLHLALEWEPPGSVDDPETPLGWAQSVLDEHPAHPTVLTTHSYLREDGRADTVEEVNGDGHSGETVWQELVAPNPQVFVVLNGHWGRYGDEYRQVSTNEAGRPVYEMLANYQRRTNGGSGLLRLVQFHPGGGEDAPDRIRVRTYSPSRDEYETDDDSEFAFDLSFEDRFSFDVAGAPRGDADGDGDVDEADVRRIQEEVANRDVDVDREAADVDGDGDVDVVDAVAVRNRIEDA